MSFHAPCEAFLGFVYDVSFAAVRMRLALGHTMYGEPFNGLVLNLLRANLSIESRLHSDPIGFHSTAVWSTTAVFGGISLILHSIAFF